MEVSCSFSQAARGIEVKTNAKQRSANSECERIVIQRNSSRFAYLHVWKLLPALDSHLPSSEAEAAAESQS